MIISLVMEAYEGFLFLPFLNMGKTSGMMLSSSPSSSL